MLCSLAWWYHWLDSQIGQGYGLGSAITPVWVGSQTVLPSWMVALAGLHVEEGCRQVFAVGQGLWLCSGIKQTIGYAPKSGKVSGCTSQSGKLLAVLHLLLEKIAG